MFVLGGTNHNIMTRFIFWALLGTVVLSPIPFGSIHPFSYSLMAIIVAILVGLWSIHLLISRQPPPVSLRMIWFPALCYGLVLIWIAIQASPYTPVALHHPVWKETADILGMPVQGYISINPYASETVIMRLLTYAGIFWLALQYGRSGKRAEQVFKALVWAGLVYAVYGLAVEFTGSETVLWFEKERYKDSLTSTFRYKNAYATYAGFGLVAAVAIIVRSLGQEEFGTMGPRERIRTVIVMTAEKLWYVFAAMAAILAALLLSDSR